MRNTHQLFREQGIDFCLVLIPAMLETLLPQKVGPGYHTRPGLQFAPMDFSIPVLSAAELDEFNRLFVLKKQVERLAGRWAVKHLVMEKTNLPLDAVDVCNDPSGAPTLSSGLDYAISITHSGDYALAALVPGKANAVGVDMETITPVDISSLLHAGFSKKEQKQYAKADLETILKIWTIKEAWLKYRQTGLKVSAKQIQWLDNTLYENGNVMNNARVKSYQWDQIVFSFVFSKS